MNLLELWDTVQEVNDYYYPEPEKTQEELDEDEATEQISDYWTSKED